MPVVNAKGTPYPKVAVEGYGEVPFPEGPYTPNNSQILRTEFSLQMRAEFKSWWTQQGRPLPASKYEIHHIQPLKFGGTNNFQNLVPLQPQQHLQFTNWWRGFTIYF
jgi:5-methylcytosine-specific restriction endonuclease McrA